MTGALFLVHGRLVREKGGGEKKKRKGGEKKKGKEGGEGCRRGTIMPFFTIFAVT